MKLITAGVIAAGCCTLIESAVAEEGLALPDPLKTTEGKRIETAEEWLALRRPELLELFRSQVYGRAPVDRPENLRFEVVEVDPEAMAGEATLKRVDIHYSEKERGGVIQLVVFIPNGSPDPAPGFLLISNRAREENIDPTRENRSPFWPAEEIVSRGFVAAAFQNSDLAPDDEDGYRNGVIGAYDDSDNPPSPDSWKAIAAWAWGASRVMDYFETDPDIDEKRMAVVGHSRGGKASLWAGAEDERFALVISNNSGCTGAALARRRQGETIARINHSFPHWFCENYKQYNGKEHELPVDQHQLIALMAPRLVYVASASEDDWADPKGEFLSCVYAEPVYKLFGLRGLDRKEMPEVMQPVNDGHIGYHLRLGRHNLTEYDWMRYMDFAEKHWGGKRDE